MVNRAPMKFLLVTVGTGGDVFPYIELGAELASRGHRAVLFADETYESLAGTRGLDFVPILSRAEIDALLDAPEFWNPFRAGGFAARWGGRFISRQYDVLSEHVRGADVVMIANPGVLAARLVQERQALPMASLLLQPWVIPSIEAPPIMPGGFSQPTWAPKSLAKLYWSAFHRVCDSIVKPQLEPVRNRLGLPPVSDTMSWWLSPELVIGMFPEWYGPPQTDWPRQIRLTDFPFPADDSNQALAPELEKFLASAESPVVCTFGTGMRHAKGLIEACVRACLNSGRSVIVLSKDRSQWPAHPPESVFRAEFVPLKTLLPRSAAIVHHGGVGTVAAAFRSGTPQVIIPFCFDQVENAVKAVRLGVGVKVGRYARTARGIGALWRPRPIPGCANARRG